MRIVPMLAVKGVKLTDAAQYLILKPFPVISEGNYEVELRYTLPGTNKVTSTYKINLKNL